MKNLSKFFLTAALLAGSASFANAEHQVTFKWDNPGAVQIADGPNNESFAIDAAATEYTGKYDETITFYLRPAPGYVITGWWKPSTTNTPTRQGCQGNITYGQQGSLFCGESISGKEVTITTKKLEYDKTLPIKVENGANCLESYFSKFWKEGNVSYAYYGKIDLQDGDNPVKYPSEYTSDLVFNKLKGSDANDIYSVTRNGQLVGDKKNQNSYSLEAITPEDEITVRVFETAAPTVEYVDLTFDLKSPLEDCISTCFDMTRSTFREIENGKINIAKGSRLKVNFKDDYTFTKFTLNGKDITSSYNESNRSITLDVDGDATFSAEGTVTVYGDVQFKVYIMNPEGLRLLKGAYSTQVFNPVLDTDQGTPITETIQLPETVIVSKSGTETKFKGATMTPENTQVFTITVSERNPELHFGPVPGYYVQAVWDATMENVLPYAPYDAVNPGNNTVYVVAEKLNLSCKVHVNLVGTEPIKFQPSQGLSTMWDNHVDSSFGLIEGEQDIFFDPYYHTPFTVRPTVDFDKFAVFVDGMQIVADDNGIYNPVFYVPVEGDDDSMFSTLTINANKEKSLEVGSISVTKNGFDFDVTYGAPKLKSANKATYLAGTPITVTPKSLDGLNLKVGDNVVYGMVDNEPVNLLKDGSYTFLVATNKLTSIVADTEPFESSAVEEINAAEANDSLIFNLQGIAVGKDFDSLPAGIYIRNGKKIMKK